MDKELRVVVGSGPDYELVFPEVQRTLAEDLSREGFIVELTEEFWPRDRWVYVSSRYLKDTESSLGEGGYTNVGKDFAVYSDMALTGKSTKEASFEEAKRRIIRDGKNHFPSTRIHVMPSGNYHQLPRVDGPIHKHGDMYFLIIPSKKLMVISDKLEVVKGEIMEEVEAVSRAEGLKVRMLKERSLWPLNSPVFPTDREWNDDVVFVKESSQELIRLLREERVRMVVTRTPYESRYGGNNCATNMYYRDDGKTLTGLLDE